MDVGSGSIFCAVQHSRSGEARGTPSPAIPIFLVRPGPAIVAAVVRLGTVWNTKDGIISHRCGGDSLSGCWPVAFGLSVLERICCDHWPDPSCICLLLPAPVQRR